MFYYVHVLQSIVDKEWYIGFTEDPKERVLQHNNGTTASTARRRPFSLIYFEGYRSKMDALGREKFLKSGTGHRYLKKQLKHFLERNP